jgi:hypothetical protein
LFEKCKQQELEKTYKALKMNGDTSPYYHYPKLLAASAMKPTLHIKRIKFMGHSHNNIQLRMASSPCPERLMKEKEMAAKAMSLNIGF